jgi:hypothetical protein
MNSVQGRVHLNNLQFASYDYFEHDIEHRSFGRLEPALERMDHIL